MGAPATHFWHKVLERLFPQSKDGKVDERAPVKKVLLDVFTFGPLYNLIALTYISTVVDGEPNFIGSLSPAFISFISHSQ